MSFGVGLKMIENYINGRFKMRIKAKEKKETIIELFDTTDQPPPLLRRVFEREDQFPTAIGLGVAIPRYIGKEIERITLSLGLSEEGVEFDALDRKPVKIIWLLLCPEESREKYTELLARLIRLANIEEFRSNVMNISSYEDLTELIKELDQ